MEEQLLNLLNQERIRGGLRKVQWNQDLADAARAHSDLLAKHKKLSHRFRGEPELQQRAGKAGAHFDAVAENVAYAPTVPDLHDGLMHSPPHRANILNPDYNAVGIAIVERDGELYATQDFARVIANASEEQFRQAVIAAFQKVRAAQNRATIAVHSDPRLHDAACSKSLNAKQILRGLPGATDLAIYTSSDAAHLPPNMRSAAGDGTLRRMNIGVCFQQDSATGFSKYWVVAAFYPVQ
ncbi:MAG TPA: CAP domain-containing protein [Terriglobales bacterium]|nr:CAP domain-containing protein [Terriglobales bacterium]